MAKNSAPPLYIERVLPALSFYTATLFLPAALFLVGLPFSELLATIVAFGALGTVWLVSWLKAPLIVITRDQLSVGSVHIPRHEIGSATDVPKSLSFEERGQRLDTRAFTRFQVGVSQLVKVNLDSKMDPTPYWLFSSRNPEVVAKILSN